ncbi:MAG TPA: carbon monoxide dehydrogenase subunit G [Gemmatimonadales bacterium]|jgi:carbon monoxide dehydrogenase subunit G|nr:carbon monoxide dehydrogenase subunit G [Gemmatimonadales bacterium]
MRLHFAGAPEIASTRAHVWRRLLDPRFVAASAPGIESVETIDPTHFRVISAFGVGAVKLKFIMNVELLDVVEPDRATMRARGKAPGSNVDVTATVALDELAPNRIRLNWTAESDLSGTVASVGARLLEGTARRLTEQFWTDFARRVQAEAAAA